MKVLIIFFNILFSISASSKVDPPNYEFKIDTFDNFYPEQTIESLKIKFPKNEKAGSTAGAPIQRFFINEQRYQITVLVQERDGAILDFFARLPSYFLHDVFLQSLVNKLGKQKSYKKNGEEAFYIWEKNNLKHIYSAACTITCFPIFYTVHPINTPPEKAFTPMIEQLKRKK